MYFFQGISCISLNFLQEFKSICPRLHRDPWICTLPVFSFISFREWAMIQVDKSHCKFIVRIRVIRMHESSVLDNFYNAVSVVFHQLVPKNFQKMMCFSSKGG